MGWAVSSDFDAISIYHLQKSTTISPPPPPPHGFRRPFRPLELFSVQWFTEKPLNVLCLEGAQWRGLEIGPEIMF